MAGGRAGDAAEREADRVADAISRAPARADAQPGFAGSSKTIHPPQAGGEPLAPAMRSDMESHLGVDLGAVRVHRDAAAAAMSRALDARAFTYGSHVWLGAGESASDRRLMAHELVHTVQQRAAGTARRIQRAPRVANQEWTVDHSDVAGNDEVTEINVAVDYLGVNQTLAAFYGWILEERPLWAKNKELYVRAIDFLRDNRDRFDVPDVHGMLRRALDYCDKSGATAATLEDKFYEGLLMAAVYSPAPGTAEFTHRTFGTVYQVPGRAAGSADFAPSGDQSLLRPDLRPDTTVTGGFSSARDLLFKYGAQPGTLTAGEVSSLLDKFKSRIPSKLQPPLKELATDPTIYAVLERFFRADGGKFLLQPVGVGGAHYTSGRPPSIEVDDDLFPGSGKDREKTAIGLRTTLAHELYHYALDRQDAALALTELGGSEDHALIQIVEDRYSIAQLVRSGQSLASDEVAALKGYVGPEIMPSLRRFIGSDDYAGLRAFVRTEDFLDATVFSMALASVGHNEALISRGLGRGVADFLFDPSQITDLLYLSAVNGVLLRRGFELAAEVAERKTLKLSAVWGDASYKTEMQSFIWSLVSLASGNRTEGVKALAARIR